MTDRPQHTAVRRLARLLALLPAVLVTCAAGTAFAEPPEQWEDSPSVSVLHGLVVFLLIPLGLFLLICLLVYLPSMTRGNRSGSGEVERGEAEWFGGPDDGLQAVDTAPTTSGSTASGSTASGSPGAGTGRGGASGSW